MNNGICDLFGAFIAWLERALFFHCFKNVWLRWLSSWTFIASSWRDWVAKWWGSLLFLPLQGAVYHVVACPKMGHEVWSITSLVLYSFPTELTLGIILSLFEMIPNSAWRHVGISNIDLRAQEYKQTSLEIVDLVGIYCICHKHVLIVLFILAWSPWWLIASAEKIQKTAVCDQSSSNAPLPGKGLLQNAPPLGYAKQANAPWWLGGGGACLDLTDTLVLSTRSEFTIKTIGQTQFIHQIVSYPLEAGCTEAK